MAGVDLLKAGLTVSGSLLSTFGTIFILLCYLILPHKRHVRHALIVNLTLADFVNALNNSISGLTVLIRNKDLTDGPGCVVNGYVGQLSVQAVDFSILAITVVTLWTVKVSRTNTDIPLSRIIGVCAASWIVPVTTSFIALFKGYYHPVGANWCWIEESPVYLRYALTHGWRIAIFFIVIGICIYIQVYLRRLFRPLPGSEDIAYGPRDERKDSMNSLADLASGDLRVFHTDDEKIIGRASMDFFNEKSLYPDSTNPDAQHEEPPHVSYPDQSMRPSPDLAALQRTMTVESGATSSTKADRSIEKTMLLNAYPILYILLWLPGIANRFAEASGHSMYVLEVAQASTQFIGFANAITFGWNEEIYRHLKARFAEKLLPGSRRRRWTIL